MSTNSECLHFKWSDGWYYLLEDDNAPRNAWDWREHATCYGPFETEEAAEQHLSANHANPGGGSHDDDPSLESEILIEHTEKARKRGTQDPLRGVPVYF